MSFINKVLDDKYLTTISKSLLQCIGKDLKSYCTPNYNSFPKEKSLRSEIFNYNILVYGSINIDNDELRSMIYFQTPQVLSKSKSAVILWCNCLNLNDIEFNEFLMESINTVKKTYEASKVKIYINTSKSYSSIMTQTLLDLGFKCELKIPDGYGNNTSFELYSCY